ncbi:MAG: hypothetical protein GX249_12075 [Firmicutes bacterium]|nr:hypothetical protein [Bacillota bacterium]
MAKNPVDLPGMARYIGSIPKNDQMCDFYEVEIDGNISYVYVPVGVEADEESP